MGTGGSFLRSNDDEDLLGSDLDGGNGVLKRIPIEIKPRGKLGLRSVGSQGRNKPKGGSLRSALSMDLENPEVERIRKDFEMYRLNRDNEMANCEKKERKLETENKRLRAELLALQKTCARMRAERDQALEAEQEALARASVFECERDKVQRQFKLFRETKESEIQNLLRAKQNLENRLSKFAIGCYQPGDDSDSHSRHGLADIGNSHPGDWWAALESEPSLGSSTVHLPQTSASAYHAYNGPYRGPELAASALEMEGPFINLNKEDWNLAVMNSSVSFPLGPTQIQSQVIRVYVAVSPDMLTEFNRFCHDHCDKLKSLCEKEGKVFTLIHLPIGHDDQEINSKESESESSLRHRQIELALIFVAFLGSSIHRKLSAEIKHACFEKPRLKTCLFIMSETSENRSTRPSQEMRELKRKIRECATPSVSVVHTSPSPGASAAAAFHDLEKIIRNELGTAHDNPEYQLLMDALPGAGRDIHCDSEQNDILSASSQASCEMGFEKYYEHLNVQVSAAGPLPPFLVIGSPGSGKSLLMAKWLQLQQEKTPTALLLHHFVGSPSSLSADPIIMIRRLTAQLMQHVKTPPPLTSDPVRLVEEFPRWLEKVSARLSGGVILVLDSVDRFLQADVHLKWLLDPLPVDARVIVSVNEETCPQAWRSWPTLHMEPSSSKHVKELLKVEIGALLADTGGGGQGGKGGEEGAGPSVLLDSERQSSIVSQCRTAATCCPLYVTLLARHLASLKQSPPKQVDRHLSAMLTCSDSFELYTLLLHLYVEGLTDQKPALFVQILQFIYGCRCGMLETELLVLLPELTWTELCAHYEFLSFHSILKYQLGVLTFAHSQAQDAVFEFCFKDGEQELTRIRLKLIKYFQERIGPNRTYSRAVDELPWLVSQTGNKQQLKECILDLGIFQQICSRGRCSELLGYWQEVEWDREKMADAYFHACKNLEAAAGHGDSSLLQVAETYETLGLFLRDLGLLPQALPALQRALEMRETALDPDDPLVGRSLHQLACLHAQWGKLSTAETLHQQALEICQTTLGAEHPLVARELEALAVLYQKMDKHDLAHPLKKRAFAIKKKLRTPRGPANGENGSDQLQRRALQLEELVIGPDSADVARSLCELGVLYYLQNNVDVAEAYIKRSLEMRESILGPDHPDVAFSLNNLAALYNDKKLYDKAEPLYVRALKIRLKNQSSESPGVASIINHLARLYKQQGKLDKAEPLYRQAVEIREKAFGPNHPSVATALVNLAVLISQQNRFSEAGPLFEQALKIYEDSLGPNHARVAETLRNLAVMKYEEEDFQTAALYYKRATEMKEQGAAYGEKLLSRRASSIDTASTVKNI